LEEARSGYKVLIVDDDEAVQKLLTESLQKEGYLTCSAYDGEEALEKIRRVSSDIILLDIVMPKVDGLMVCREIRKESTVPIIMISAKTDEFDMLLGLELGADDYIKKPLSTREVAARMKCLLRRVHEMKGPSTFTHLVIGNLEIDMNAFTIKVGGKTLPSTPKEIEIMWMLASNPGMVFSREHLLQSIWGYDYMGDTRAVDSHIKRIRAKFCHEENGWDIKTVWGVGYRFEIDE